MVESVPSVSSLFSSTQIVKGGWLSINAFLFLSLMRLDSFALIVTLSVVE